MAFQWLSGNTIDGLLITDTSTTSSAGLRLPHGTAPTSPTDGDLWSTTAGLYARINGATVGPLGVGNQEVYTQTSAPTSTAFPIMWIDIDDEVTGGGGGGGGGAPSGPAGGDLAGTYPDPTLAVDRVNITGDIMTGDLRVNSDTLEVSPDSGPAYLQIKSAASQIQFQMWSASGQTGYIYWRNSSGVDRWTIGKTDATDAGSNVGSDFKLSSYADGGTLLDDEVLKFTRSTGLGTVKGDPTANLGIATKQYVDTRTPKITVSTTAPGSPATNDIWVDTN